MTPEIQKRIEQIRRGEVPEGYKKTKSGIIPQEWSSVRVGEIARIYSGSTPSRSNPAYWNGTIPWITTGELNNPFITQSKEFITEKALSATSLSVIPKDSIIMAMYGQGKTRGTVSILGIEATVNQACAVFELKQDNTRYIFYQLQSRYDLIRRLSNTGNQENLNADIIRSINLPVLPLDEEKRIVNILQEQEHRLAEKQEQKKYLMQVLLTGKKRLPGFSGAWSKVKAKQLFENISDKRHDGTLEVLSATQEQGVIPRSMVDIDIKYDKESLSSYKRIQKGDFVISLRSFQGGIEYSEYDGLVSPAYTVLRAKKTLCDKFYRQFFKSSDYIQRLNIATYGIRDGKQISYKDFGDITIPFPSFDEQTAIAEVLSTADKEITLLQKDLELEKQKKKALMQLLLTGIVRV